MAALESRANAVRLPVERSAWSRRVEGERPAWVNDYLGLPFRSGGRDRRVGVDCYGLVMLIYEEQFGLPLDDFAGIDYDDDRRAISRAECAVVITDQARHWRRVEPGDQRLGDVLIVNLAGWPCHVGVFVPPCSILHTEAGLDCAVERLDSMAWSSPKRIYGAFRHAARA